jgi:hypothetical protein
LPGWRGAEFREYAEKEERENVQFSLSFILVFCQ